MQPRAASAASRRCPDPARRRESPMGVGGRRCRRARRADASLRGESSTTATARSTRTELSRDHRRRRASGAAAATTTGKTSRRPRTARLTYGRKIRRAPPLASPSPLVLRQPERGIHVWILRAKPVAERRPQQLAGGGGRSALHDVVLVVEEIGRVFRV